jgi:hypothetical protein
VFSVDTEEDAKQLITLCCPRDDVGAFYARELAHEQTLENLQEFSDKLARGYALLVEKGVIKPVASAKRKRSRRSTPR